MGDSDRQRVYDAELAAFGGTNCAEVVPWHEVVAVFETVVRHRWWQDLAVPVPRLVRGRQDSGRSSWDGAIVRIAPGGQTTWTLAHELAHHLVGHLGFADPGHGLHFRAVELRTVELVCGSRPRQILDEEWSRWRLAVAPWVLAEPPVGSGLSSPGEQAGPLRLRGAIAL